MLMLPTVSQQSIRPAVIDWSGLSNRYSNPGELECVVGLLQEVKPRVMIEFGVNEGRTAKVILRTVPSIQHYLGIDVPLGFVTAKAVQRNEVPQQPAHLVRDDPRFTLLLSNRGSQSLWPDDLHLADAVFIDGDHSYKGVMHDTMLAKAVMRPGGIIIYHDTMTAARWTCARRCMRWQPMAPTCGTPRHLAGVRTHRGDEGRRMNSRLNRQITIEYDVDFQVIDSDTESRMVTWASLDSNALWAEVQDVPPAAAKCFRGRAGGAATLRDKISVRFDIVAMRIGA
jgi:predicted O-methyltransferase YrrM